MALRCVAVVQVRLGSSRLPGKALAEVAGRPMLAHVVARARAIPGLDEIVIATTDQPRDEPVVRFAVAAGLPWVRGSEDDVLDRFQAAVRAHPADAIVRITPDCPLLDPAVSARVVAEFVAHGGRVGYVSNVHPPTYPDGLDTEVFSREALEAAWREARHPADREHVTPYIWDRPERFGLVNVRHAEDLSALRWTVDTAGDLEFVRAVYAALNPDGTRPFGMAEVLALLRAHPELATLNAGLTRNEKFAGSGKGNR
jgi:spore coat polysaccharide biosynthesis protein SpsF